MTTPQEIFIEGSKAVPPVAVSVVTLFGMTLSDWAYLLTIVYTFLMIIHFVYTKTLKPWRDSLKDDDLPTTPFN